MPSTGKRPEDVLIDLFLSVYDRGLWATSHRDAVDKRMDSGVEVIATRPTDGLTLAIEHTLVEPFIGEKTDFHNNFKDLAVALRADPELKVEGEALWVSAPVNALPKGADRVRIISDVTAWLKANRASFSDHVRQRECTSAHHPDGKVVMEIRLNRFDDSKASFVIVQRYGDIKVDEGVRKALGRKLPKLVATAVDRRILMLERDQIGLYAKAVHEEVERLRPEFPDLSKVHEVWIADTATMSGERDYSAFERFGRGRKEESFAFHQGRLLWMSKNGMPVPQSRWVQDPNTQSP